MIPDIWGVCSTCAIHYLYYWLWRRISDFRRELNETGSLPWRNDGLLEMFQLKHLLEKLRIYTAFLGTEWSTIRCSYSDQSFWQIRFISAYMGKLKYLNIKCVSHMMGVNYTKISPCFKEYSPNHVSSLYWLKIQSNHAGWLLMICPLDINSMKSSLTEPIL